MKITHNKVGQNLNLTDAGKVKTDNVKNKSDSSQVEKSLAAALQDGSDSTKVDLSPRAHDIKRIKDLAMSAPDVDQAKVDKFRKLIAEGKYKVDAKAVADKMVEEHLASNLTSHGTSND